MSLKELVKQDPLKPFGETDVLLFYAIASTKLKDFLKGKELATKVWLPTGNLPSFLNRGSKKEPLYIEEMAEVDEDFLALRKAHLDEVRNKLNKTQQKIWEYFPPRKLMDFFYATNGEAPGKPIDRIFFDIDRGENVTSDHARQVADVLANEVIPKDPNLPTQKEPFVMWTGSSFHIYLFLKKKEPNEFYVKNFQYSKNSPDATFTGRWAKIVREETKLNVGGGHEKEKDRINIDPSQTPSGKLARVPLSSLHMKDAKTVDGVSIPVERKMLKKSDLVERLREYNPAKVIKELDSLAKLLP
jgi:hypothetical protein